MSDNAPRVPSAYQLERAVSAWQQVRELYASDPALADDEEVISSALADAEITHPETLLSRAIDALVWIEQREVEADDLRRQDTARRDRYRARGATVRSLVESLLTALDKKSHRATRARAIMAMSRGAVVILDEQLLVPPFVRIERSPDKTAIREAIEAGQDVAGATMSNAAPALQIRKL
jgi:hypothetical protein